MSILCSRECPAHSTGNDVFYHSTAVAAYHLELKPCWWRYKIWTPMRKRRCISTMQATLNSASLTRGRISQKNIDEAVDQRRKPLVWRKSERDHTEYLLNYVGFLQAIILLY